MFKKITVERFFFFFLTNRQFCIKFTAKKKKKSEIFYLLLKKLFPDIFPQASLFCWWAVYAMSAAEFLNLIGQNVLIHFLSQRSFKLKSRDSFKVLVSSNSSFTDPCVLDVPHNLYNKEVLKTPLLLFNNEKHCSSEAFCGEKFSVYERRLQSVSALSGKPVTLSFPLWGKPQNTRIWILHFHSHSFI